MWTFSRVLVMLFCVILACFELDSWLKDKSRKGFGTVTGWELTKDYIAGFYTILGLIYG
jgi:hypothetical protein